MRFAFWLLLVLTGFAPLFLAADSQTIHGLLAGYIALIVAIVALSIRPGEADYLSRIIRPALFLAAIPALWILIQAIPLPIDAVQHPIWASAQAALNNPPVGSISADRGATLVGFIRYLSACGLFFGATAITIDRQRAEIVLFWLAAISTLMAAVLIVHDLGGMTFLGTINDQGPRASIAAAATLGTVLTTATMMYALERYETRHGRTDGGRHTYIIIMIAAFSGLTICSIAIVLFMSTPTIFAAVCGFAAFVLIVGFRRLGLQSSLGFLPAAAAIAIPLSIVARTAMTEKLDWTLRFNVAASRPLIEMVQRMISDTSWFGSGAGTFTDLLPIYQSTNDVVPAPMPPTTAAGVLIELGSPALWVIVVIAVIAAILFIRGALERGRDSFFPAASAACVVVLLIEAFFDASLSGSAVIVIATATLGLGLSQSVSRTTR